MAVSGEDWEKNHGLLCETQNAWLRERFKFSSKMRESTNTSLVETGLLRSPSLSYSRWYSWKSCLSPKVAEIFQALWRSHAPPPSHPSYAKPEATVFQVGSAAEAESFLVQVVKVEGKPGPEKVTQLRVRPTSVLLGSGEKRQLSRSWSQLASEWNWKNPRFQA